MRSLETILEGAGKALVLGIGGGGDVVGALATARLCESFGCDFVVGGIPWERLPYDPEPGPRSLGEMVDAEQLNHSVALAGPKTRTASGVTFAESHMARYLGRKTLLVDVLGGADAVAEGIEHAAEALGADLAVFVDAGGDVLADGSEPGLASPLCDAVMLAAGAKLQERVECVAAIFGPGCDGELTHDELLGRIARVAAAGGWLGAWGLTPAVTSQLEEATRHVPTEASAQAIRCARGELGATAIRGGRREVQLSPLGALTLYFDPRTAVRSVARLARAVSGSGSFEEANEALHRVGVRTELDLERERTER